METDITREDSPKGRKSSILKASKPRLPLQDVNLGSNIEEDTTEIRRRRVSFSSVNQIKKFNANAESLLVSGTPAYEEQFSAELSAESPNIQNLMAAAVQNENTPMKIIEVISSPVNVSSPEEEISMNHVGSHHLGSVNHVPIVMGQVPTTPGVWSLDESANIPKTPFGDMSLSPGNMSFTVPLSFPLAMASQNTMEFTASVNPTGYPNVMEDLFTTRTYASAMSKQSLAGVASMPSLFNHERDSCSLTIAAQHSMELSNALSAGIPVNNLTHVSDVEVKKVITGHLPYNTHLRDMTGAMAAEDYGEMDMEVSIACTHHPIGGTENREMPKLSIDELSTTQINSEIVRNEQVGGRLSVFDFQVSNSMPKETNLDKPFPESGGSIDETVNMEISVICTAKDPNFANKSSEEIETDPSRQTDVKVQENEPDIIAEPTDLEVTQLAVPTEIDVPQGAFAKTSDNADFQENPIVLENRDVMSTSHVDNFLHDHEATELSKICSVDDSDLDVTAGEASVDVVTATYPMSDQVNQLPLDSPNVGPTDMEISIPFPSNDINYNVSLEIEKSNNVPLETCKDVSALEICITTDIPNAVYQSSGAIQIPDQFEEAPDTSPPRSKDSDAMELSNCADKCTNIIVENLPVAENFNSPAFKKTKVSLIPGTNELDGSMEITEAIDCRKPYPPTAYQRSPENVSFVKMSSKKRKSLAQRQSFVLDSHVSKLKENIDCTVEKSLIFRNSSTSEYVDPAVCHLTMPSIDMTSGVDRSELSVIGNQTFGITNLAPKRSISPSVNVPSPRHSKSPVHCHNECSPITSLIPGTPLEEDKNSYVDDKDFSYLSPTEEMPPGAVDGPGQVDDSLPLPVFTVDNPVSPERQDLAEPKQQSHSFVQKDEMISKKCVSTRPASNVSLSLFPPENAAAFVDCPDSCSPQVVPVICGTPNVDKKHSLHDDNVVLSSPCKQELLESIAHQNEMNDPEIVNISNPVVPVSVQGNPSSPHLQNEQEEIMLSDEVQPDHSVTSQDFAVIDAAPVQLMSELSLDNACPSDKMDCEEVCENVVNNPQSDDTSIEAPNNSSVKSRENTVVDGIEIPALRALSQLPERLTTAASQGTEKFLALKNTFSVCTRSVDSSCIPVAFVSSLSEYKSEDGKLLSAEELFSKLMKKNGFFWKESITGGLWVKGFLFNNLLLGIRIETPTNINVIKTRSALWQLPITCSSFYLSKSVKDESLRFMLEDMIKQKTTLLSSKLKCFYDLKEFLEVVTKDTKVIFSVCEAVSELDYVGVNNSFLDDCFVFIVFNIRRKVEFEVHISLQNLKQGLQGIKLKVVKLEGFGNFSEEEVYSMYYKIPDDKNKFVTLFKELSCCK